MGQPDVYRQRADPSVYVRFPLVDDDADLLVWTTTPWTLISNVAVAVGPDIAYVRVHEPEGRDLVMAEAAAERLFGAGAPYDVVARLSAGELVGHRYQRPFELLELPAPTMARDWCTWPRPSARTTPPSVGPSACPCSTPSVPTARSTPGSGPGPG
jgi:isoleucyl-tRNA synthetase